jgi:hypothetical protein
VSDYTQIASAMGADQPSGDDDIIAQSMGRFNGSQIVVVLPPPPAGAITAPTLTRTSAADVNPPVITITRNSTIVIGQYWRFQLAANSGFTTPLSGESAIRETFRPITSEDFASGEAQFDALNGIPGGQAWFARLFVESDSGEESDPSNTVSGTTVLASTATLASADGANRNQFVTTSGGNLTMALETDVGGLAKVRTTTQATGKKHFEATINGMQSGYSRVAIGVCDAATDFSGNYSPVGVTFQVTSDPAADIFVNGSYNSTGPNIGGFAVGDVLVVEFDTTTRQVDLWRVRSGTATVAGTVTIGAGIITNWTAFGGGYSNNGAADSLTFNFGASAFAKAPSTGYSFYG